MYCQNCGAELNEEARFCPACGKEQRAEAASPPVSSENAPAITKEEWKAFIGDNSEKYLKKFEKFSLGGVENFSLTWHWPALFFGPFWALYRKLYLASVVLLILSFIPVANLLVGIAFAMVANYLYYKDARAKILKFSHIQPIEQRLEVLSKAGGVHVWVAALVIILSIFFLFVAILGGMSD